MDRLEDAADLMEDGRAAVVHADAKREFRGVQFVARRGHVDGFLEVLGAAHLVRTRPKLVALDAGVEHLDPRDDVAERLHVEDVSVLAYERDDVWPLAEHRDDLRAVLSVVEVDEPARVVSKVEPRDMIRQISTRLDVESTKHPCDQVLAVDLEEVRVPRDLRVGDEFRQELHRIKRAAVLLRIGGALGLRRNAWQPLSEGHVRPREGREENQ